MHKIINKKSIQKITAIIIIMIMCNFIMSTKAWAAGAVDSEAGTSTGTTTSTSGQNSGSIQQAVNAGVSVDAIKKSIKSQLNIENDSDVDKVYASCYNDTTKITVKYTVVASGATAGSVRFGSVDVTNVSSDDVKGMIDGSYNSNLGSKQETAGGATGTNGETASAGSYAQDVADQEGANANAIGGLLARPIAALVLGICDGVNYILQSNIIGDKSDVFIDRGIVDHSKVIQTVTDNPTKTGLPEIKIVEKYLDDVNGGYGIPNIKLTPAEIFAGNVSALDANFFKTEADHNNELGGSDKSIVEKLRSTVSKWYVALRNIAIVGLLSALLYIGIRIVISSSNGDKAKYKQFFVDWVVALCLIFFMHYIMAFTMTMSETVTDVLAGDNTSNDRVKEVNIILTKTDGTTPYVEDDKKVMQFSSNFTGVARIKATYQSGTLKLGYSVLYIGLTVYTVYFAFVYLKRLLMLAFFTMIAPMVALTYPLDKIKDGKAQAFNYWFKEYMFYALLQPLHMLLYTVFVSSALDVAANNLLYAIVALAFIVPAEKIVKQMFGIKGNTESTLGGFAGGALASQAFSMLKKGPPQPKKGGESPKGEKGIRLTNPNKPDAMDTLAGSAAARQISSAQQNAREETRRNNEEIERQQLEEQLADGQLEKEQLTAEQRRILGMEQQRQQEQQEQQEQQQTEHGNQEENPEVQNGENTAMPGNQQQNQNTDNNSSDEDHSNDNPFAAIRAKANSRTGDLGKAINMRVQNAGGWSGIAKSAGKTGAKLVGRAAMMTTMGALGLGVGIVGGDMSDTLKGLGAGLTAGYATGGRLNSAVGNTFAGNNALGRFGNDAFRGMGPERQRNDYIRSYMSNRENRSRLIQKNPNISKKELDAELKQRAELSYDSGVTDAKKLDRAVKLKKRMDEQNPTGKDNEREEKHGANYDKLVARMQLSEKYSDSTFDDDDKIAKKQRRLARDIERSMNERTNGPIDEATARSYKAKANAEAAETMNDIDYLKNG